MKVDLWKEHKAEYVAPREPQRVRIGKAQYLTIEGRGAPGGAEFQSRIGALYGVAWTAKMTLKAAGRDYKVCPLETLWWSDGEFASTPKEQWRWKLLIRTPDFVRARDVKAAAAALVKRGKREPVGDVALEKLAEGECLQVLHVGPYDDVGRIIARMEEVAAASGASLHGRHHEIYLSDPRRVAPARLRTIIRRPIRQL